MVVLAVPMIATLFEQWRIYSRRCAADWPRWPRTPWASALVWIRSRPGVLCAAGYGDAGEIAVRVLVITQLFICSLYWWCLIGTRRR